MTKHEQIIKHIEKLSIGQKISVRKIAKDLEVSEGTAYRAIKDAGQRGLVATIDRVGTVRIEKKSREQLDVLTFGEIAKIVDGQLIAGKGGQFNSLTKFAIGAMEVENVVNYVSKNTLLIVGNRVDVQKAALKKGSAVLITGGFETSDEIVKYADEHDLPIISSNYDTFMVANIINRAMYNQMIKKEILLVEDIVIPIEETSYLYDTMAVKDVRNKSHETGHSRFPVVDKEMKLTGIITSKDILSQSSKMQLSKVMSKPPMSAQLSTTVASCAHSMIWEGIELLPVTSADRRLIGVISREDVLKAMQIAGRQPQVGETINDQVAKHIDIRNNQIKVEITPQLTNQFGTLSKSVSVAIIEETIKYVMRKHKKLEVMIESLNIFYIKTVQIENEVEVLYNILDMGRNFAKLEVTMQSGQQPVATALLMCQLLDN
ncbi:DRTGG domain-containing protein [Staphylococcus chromogenes]|uniref:CBS domain-containing protein n=1 Tax=Staphylococcus chromogenes TaxID=46126 RepID=A0AAE5T272_STACR|nr:DRTGG domain-containing protein [Staphylococcus chromogenes]MBP0045625.1 CBS domain-containing protein [Staphylococcus chromogenes]MBV5190664.1 CBS domain-containing protein [Staphylococcus chromogenes]MBW3133344.1 CBS domain-containing protein [Staphylococcus chromogenes]MCE5042208.1 CBS domain-containing protein [Staphylococcus chromogenes]MCE5091459.1 CBS domain-containing protein [Staphylococcus chromogenes]